MKLRHILSALALIAVGSAVAQTKPDTLWFKDNNRFVLNTVWDLAKVDSIVFTRTALQLYYDSTYTLKRRSATYKKTGTYQFGTPERTIIKPNNYYANDYTNENSQWCFQRSMESEHFICFWESGLKMSSSGVISLNGQSINVKTLLQKGEEIYDCYVNKLGFLKVGSSTTDKYKIIMHIVNQTDWRADGSGNDGSYLDGTTWKSAKVGLFHCNPSAASARGWHTPAHEIGHVFQYLVSADLGLSHGLNYGYGEGASGGNCWWEDCANWQAYKYIPSRQFTDGEYYEQHLTKHHLNLLHEDARYTNCFYQDWWCMKHGMTTVGRIWREATKPEDPVQAYMRIFGLDDAGFAAEMYEGFARMASWDIDGVRDAAKHRIGSHLQRLIDPSAELAAQKLDGNASYWWVVDPAYCPQNYGYNINPLKVPEAGTTVGVTFRGIAGATGYRAVQTAQAGWRYGLVAYTNKGERVYSEMQSDANDGRAELTIPEGTTNLWLVVMGAPKKWWRHAWDDDATNDEQWPYAVHFDGTDPLGVSRTYGEYPADYERKDTTVVINANLAYSSTDWSSTRVQLDMDAISQALGVSTAQMKAAVCGKKTAAAYPYVRIAALNANKTTETNSKTISDTDVIFGHWFSTAGNATSGLDGSAAIYTKIYHDKYGCYVGQRPGALTKGRTYTVREAVIYTHTDGKEYKAIMEIRLKIQ